MIVQYARVNADGRPIANMKSAFLILLWFLFVFCRSAMAQPAPPDELISNFRLQHGEGRVTLDHTLNRVARDQAAAMAAKDVLNHDVLGPFNSRVASAGAGRAAENIAYGYEGFPKTLNQWIESSGHRKNLLLHDATRVGIASARSPKTGRTYWAMVIAGGFDRPTRSDAKPGLTAKPKVHARQACRMRILGLCL